MDDKLNRIKQIDKENIIWIIYIGIIILSWYSNSKEKKYILYNDLESKKEYQNTIIFIFLVLVVIYYYFVKDGYEDVEKLKESDSNKKKDLTYLSFTGQMLILISGIIFLYIALVDDDIDVELAFN